MLPNVKNLIVPLKPGTEQLPKVTEDSATRITNKILGIHKLVAERVLSNINSLIEKKSLNTNLLTTTHDHAQNFSAIYNG